MKHLLLTTIAVVLLVGCGESQSPEPPTAKASYISIHELLRLAERNRRPRQLTQPV